MIWVDFDQIRGVFHPDHGIACPLGRLGDQVL
jgi:hypothetical protein